MFADATIAVAVWRFAFRASRDSRIESLVIDKPWIAAKLGQRLGKVDDPPADAGWLSLAAGLATAAAARRGW